MKAALAALVLAAVFFAGAISGIGGSGTPSAPPVVISLSKTAHPQASPSNDGSEEVNHKVRHGHDANDDHGGDDHGESSGSGSDDSSGSGSSGSGSDDSVDSSGSGSSGSGSDDSVDSSGSGSGSSEPSPGSGSGSD